MPAAMRSDEPFSRGALTLLRVRSIPIRAHWSLLLVLPYMVMTFALRFAAVANASGVAPEATAIPPVAWGLIVALALFASIVVHELAHTFVAIRAGGRVRAITLMMLGGVSQIERLPKRPGMEALMAAAGPATSLLIGGALLALGRIVDSPDGRIGVFYIARLNIVLGLFNLLPAFPMDGGRVLRALLATRMGMAPATRIAATVGKGAAIALGLAGAFGGSIILMLIALFLFTGAQLEMSAHEMKEALAHLRVGDLMSVPAPTVGIDDSAAEALERMRRSSRLDLLVLDDAGRPLGILRGPDVARVDPAARETMPLRELRDAIDENLVTALPDEPADAALERARDSSAAYLVVVAPSPVARAEQGGEQGDQEGRWIAGLVGPTELEHAFALRSVGPPPKRWRPTERRPQPV